MLARTTASLTIPAILLTACATTRPGALAQVPPSASVPQWDEMAAPKRMYAPSMDEIAARWLLPQSSPWAAYDKMTLLAALGSTDRVIELPNVSELDVVLDAQRAAEVVARVGVPNALWVVDLRGAASVAFAASLSQASSQSIAPVLTFNNWPAQDELVPAEETLAALVSMQPRLPTSEADHGIPVFLLDAWRLAYKNERPDDETTDNRYMLTPSDLPAPEVLLSRGINSVMYVVENLAVTTTEEDDLHETFAAYQESGITITMVDLRWLFALDNPARWDERRERNRLIIEPRVTLLQDEHFYRRAHGGFGGVQVYSGGGGHGFGAGIGHGGHGGG